MLGFSHTDRLGSSAKRLLDLRRVQRVICGTSVGQVTRGVSRPFFLTIDADGILPLSPSILLVTGSDGSDIFGMLPEAYRFKDLISLWSPDRSLSAVGLPRRVLDHGKTRFRYLLPGGCVRDS